MDLNIASCLAILHFLLLTFTHREVDPVFNSDDFIAEFRRDLRQIPSQELLTSLKSVYDDLVSLMNRYLSSRAAFRHNSKDCSIDTFRTLRDNADLDLKSLMEAKSRLDMLVTRLGHNTAAAVSHFKDDLFRMFEMLHK